jgi:hypothetical protein
VNFLNWFRARPLDAVLSPKKRIKVQGVVFIIKKIDVLDHLEGAKVLQKSYDTYKVERESGKDIESVVQKKVREHYADVILAGVVSPKIKRKQDDPSGEYWVQDLFQNWDLVENLYSEILEFTYGKKKLTKALGLKS